MSPAPLLVFFDVDGVVIDGWNADLALRRPWDAHLQEHLGVDRAAFQRLLFSTGPGQARSRMADCIVGQRDLRDALAEILPELGYTDGPSPFMRYWFTADSALNEPLLRTIDELRATGAIRPFLATGQEQHRARFLWHDLGLSQRFERMFFSAAIGAPKQDPRFYATIRAMLNMAPDERPLLFDDQPELTTLAAAHGWDATPYRSVADVRDHPRLAPLFPA